MERMLRTAAIAAALFVVTPWLPAAPITVQNAGFESGILSLSGNGTFSQLIAGSTIFVAGGTLNNWTASSTTVASAAGGFDPSPGGPNWTSTWWSGNNIGYVQINAPGTVSLSQTLADTLLNDSTYTLSALIGRRAFTPTFNYAIQLWAGSTMLASASNLSLANNSSGADSATYISGSNNALAGQALSIVLTSTEVQGSLTEAFFDNVGLDVVTQSSGVPEPATFGLAVAGIAAGVIASRRRAKSAR